MWNAQPGSVLKGQYLPGLTEQRAVHQILSLHTRQTSLQKENTLLWKLATYENPLLFSKILLRFFKHSAPHSKNPFWFPKPRTTITNKFVSYKRQRVDK